MKTTATTKGRQQRTRLSPGDASLYRDAYFQGYVDGLEDALELLRKKAPRTGLDACDMLQENLTKLRDHLRGVRKEHVSALRTLVNTSQG